MIYNEKIKLSYVSINIDVELLLKKRKKNRKETNRIQEVDDVLAALNYRLKKSQNYSSKNDEALRILEKTANEFVEDAKLMENVKMKSTNNLFKKQKSLKKKWKGLIEFIMTNICFTIITD